MICQKTSIENTQIIANLHKTGIPTGFLSKQPSYFLEALYAYLIKEELVYVVLDDEKVIGFIAVSKNTSGLYKKFLKSNIPLLVRFTLQNIFSIDFIKKAFETLNAPKKARLKNAPIELPELLSIVVDSSYMGKGVGKKLLECVENELISLGFEEYKVLVGANLEANGFYKKHGFTEAQEVELHEGSISYIYTKKIEAKKGDT